MYKKSLYSYSLPVAIFLVFIYSWFSFLLSQTKQNTYQLKLYNNISVQKNKVYLQDIGVLEPLLPLKEHKRWKNIYLFEWPHYKSKIVLSKQEIHWYLLENNFFNIEVIGQQITLQNKHKYLLRETIENVIYKQLNISDNVDIIFEKEIPNIPKDVIITVFPLDKPYIPKQVNIRWYSSFKKTYKAFTTAFSISSKEEDNSSL